MLIGKLDGARRKQKSQDESQAKQQEAIKVGLLALLHDRIFAIHAICDQKHYATVEEFRNLDYLYQPYHALGGNGTGTELYNRVKKMPTEPPETTA